jgi:hypothetical protein
VVFFPYYSFFPQYNSRFILNKIKATNKELTVCRSAGERAFHEIYRLLEEERQEHHLAPLQQGLLAASVLAVLLLLILILVLARNR